MSHKRHTPGGDLYNVTRSEPPGDPVHISISEMLMWTNDLVRVHAVTLYRSPGAWRSRATNGITPQGDAGLC